jgi:four helix bundle protein
VPSRENVIEEKSFQFAVRAVKCFQVLSKRSDSVPIARQFVRAATSIGANIAEARDAQSRADFVSKTSIALKEARESHYWIRLMAATELLSEKEAQSLMTDCDELLRLLTSIVKTTRNTKPSQTDEK